MLIIRGLATVLLLAALSQTARAEDPRTPIRLTPDTRSQLREEMRGHMEALDDVIASVAAGNFARAAEEARTKLGIGSGKGLGRFMPTEFRQMGMGMHRSALDFADAASAVPTPATAADWQKAVTALSSVATACRGCHATFRIE